MKIIIIGGVAAGAKAAAKSKKLNPEAEIHIYTQDKYVSYSSCGLPYYIAGEFEDWHKLIVRTKEEFEKSGINIHTNNKVTEIIPNKKQIKVNNDLTNSKFRVDYDKLIISTGANPFIPNIKNKDLRNIFTLRNLEDGINIRKKMLESNSITLIGGGYISIELLEAFIKNNKKVTLIEQAHFILPNFDEDMSSLIQNYILENSDNSLTILEEESITEFIGENYVEGFITSNGITYKTDMVIIASGVYPESKLAKGAGILLGENDSIKVNSRMETNIPDIYACGDCAEKTNIISNMPVWIPLGSTANKEGRIAAINACGGSEDFEGVLGSAALRFKNLSIAITGLTEKLAKKQGFDPVSILITKRDKAGYMPEVQNITLKLIADKRTHRILGAQAMGCGIADKKVNTISVGLLRYITIEELLDADLTYAPPFSSSIDILITAARILKSKLS